MSKPMKGGHLCAFKGCKSSSRLGVEKISFFRFPKDPERCRQWVDGCNRFDLHGKELETLYNYYRVCSKHFEQNMFLNNLKNRLQSHATPSDNIPKLNLKCKSSESIRCSLVKVPEPNLQEDVLTINEECTSDQQVSLVGDEDRRPACLSSISTTSRQTESLLDVNLPSTSSSKSDIHTQTSNSLTSRSPRELKLRKKITALKRTVKKLQKTNLARDNLDDISLNQFDTLLYKFLPEQTAKFVSVQAHEHAKKGCGRRFTDDFKKFCLGIYFMSPKCYHFLSKTFLLPSNRTLQKMTETIM